MPLARNDWIEAAVLALARDGLSGVAVEPLARRLGTTKGSFYWHFADRAELIGATLELWHQRETVDVIDRLHSISDPREQLTSLAAGAFADAARGSAHAGVLAAASDPHVRKALERFTRTWLAFLERLYGDLGLAPAPATRHARLAYALYLGIGELRHADPDSDPTGDELDDYLKLAVESIMPSERAA